MALFRAVESARPARTRLFTDPLAPSLLPPRSGGWRAARLPVLGRVVPTVLDIGWPRTRSSGVVRTRLIDQSVEDAIGDGATQLVLLGAGFDSRAYRLPGARTAEVFEVDHPSTQRAKRTRLQSLGTPVDHVHFVAVDFEHDDVARWLADNGFDRHARSVVVWEGVISYLTAPAVDTNFDLLADICSLGSRLVFTYVDGRAIDGSVHFDEADRWKGWVRLNGEPFVFGFDPGELPGYLARRGFRLDSDRTTADVARHYATTIGRHELGSELYRVAAATRVGDAAGR